jgi:hypothetical protein
MTEIRNLVLYTSWISNSIDANDYFNTTISNSVGTISNNRNSMTWNNINLRQLMGDTYYNSYNKFSIKISGSTTNVLLTTSLANSYRKSNDYFFDYYLSGLQFDPSLSQVLISSGNLLYPPTTAGALLGYGSATKRDANPEYTFIKPQQDTVNISINLLIANTQQICVPQSSNEILGHSLYNFEIKGIL